jgi:hypothetical protein
MANGESPGSGLARGIRSGIDIGGSLLDTFEKSKERTRLERSRGLLGEAIADPSLLSGDRPELGNIVGPPTRGQSALEKLKRTAPEAYLKLIDRRNARQQAIAKAEKDKFEQQYKTVGIASQHMSNKSMPDSIKLKSYKVIQSFMNTHSGTKLPDLTSWPKGEKAKQLEEFSKKFADIRKDDKLDDDAKGDALKELSDQYMLISEQIKDPINTFLEELEEGKSTQALTGLTGLSPEQRELIGAGGKAQELAIDELQKDKEFGRQQTLAELKRVGPKARPKVEEVSETRYNKPFYKLKSKQQQDVLDTINQQELTKAEREGGIPLEKKVKTDIQEDIVASSKHLASMQDILNYANIIPEEAFQFIGKGKAGLSAFASKVGLDAITPEQWKEMETTVSAMKAQIGESFQIWRKWATGVQAGEKELKQLLATFPNEGDSLRSFVSKAKKRVEMSKRMIARLIRLDLIGKKELTLADKKALKSIPLDSFTEKDAENIIANSQYNSLFGFEEEAVRTDSQETSKTVAKTGTSGGRNVIVYTDGSWEYAE